ncbi:MAG: WGR domain-containing protein [Polyangiaceae bacterium]|nr:WGR domain-containing protein [Polyangiaceae bacterium]
MRRFELVEGKSAKFWQADVSGSTFIVEYGRLGTAGQRKEKDFGSDALAKREYEKKVAEKLREGYSEVRTDGAAQAPKGAKGAQAASAKLDLPPRIATRPGPVPEAAILASATALSELALTAGRRSFVTAHAFKRARRALRALGGADVSTLPTVAAELDRVMDLAVRADGPRLSLARCMELLAELPTSAFERAMERWQAGKNAPAMVALLTKEVEELEDAELAFRLGALITTRPGRTQMSDAGVRKASGALLPLLQAHLVRRSSSPRKHLAAVDTAGDTFAAERVAALLKAAGG